jgi:hypothetical protein
MPRLIIFSFCFSFFTAAFSQELNCRVIVDAEQIQITERAIFQEMETAFAEFLNSRKWTEDEYLNQERITCNIILNLDPERSEPAANRYAAQVQILSSRPVYNTGYETVVFNFADRDWLFEYAPSYQKTYSN